MPVGKIRIFVRASIAMGDGNPRGRGLSIQVADTVVLQRRRHGARYVPYTRGDGPGRPQRARATPWRRRVDCLVARAADVEGGLLMTNTESARALYARTRKERFALGA